MILLFLSWPQTRCTEDLKGEEIFDQLATASETVVHAVKNEDSTDLEEQPSSISDATVHYENSNGFVPMVRSISYDDLSQINDHKQRRFEESNATIAVSAQDNSDERARKLEEDLAYSSEARIFLSHPRSLTNRRSFDFQDERLNEFELLKVNNDTPAVANYQDFYENVRDTMNTKINSEPGKSSSRRPNGERGKRLENHTRNYGWQSQQGNDEDIYAQFYNNAQNTKRTVYEQEKVAGNYQQQNSANYNELSAAKQNTAAIPSSSRTNYEANELANSGTYGDVESSRTRHRFMKPVVVVEPSNHKVDVKFSSQLQSSESDNDDKILKNLESSNSETSNQYDAYNNNNSRQRSYHRTEDSRDVSDESTDYSDYVDRSRLKAQKSRRRPDSTRKLPKEHRGTLNESSEEGKYSSSRQKSQRHRMKANPWLNDPSTNHHDESAEDIKYDYGTRGSSTKTKSTNVQHGSGSKNTNTWNQISPNLEISHSNGIELDQLEKPKYVVNLVPVANFDHATALGSSQGFDMSNAMLQNLATVRPIGAFSTTAPVLNTPQSILAQNLAISKNMVSTPVPDIIIGQNTFQNPVHTVLLSHPNGQNKIVDTLRATYVPSTMTPVFALTPSLTPALQSVSVNGMQNVTPRTTITVVPQPTIQTYPGFLQTPLQANQIQVNTHGLQGQNLINHGNLQVQSLPTVPTLLSNQAMPESRTNLASVETQSKKNMYPTSDANFLATASLAVEQKQATNVNPYYVQNQNTQMIPNQQNLQELQVQMNKQAKGGRLSGIVLQAADSATSHTINNLNTLRAASGNAHLPNLGAKNVEIVNPNIKLPTSLNTNTYQIHYPTNVLTTPIPIFSTIASATPQTAVNLQNYVNSLTESGTKTKQMDLKSAQERPMFNPINFVPNVNIIKNQNALNNKLPSNEPVQPGLNLVSAVPGGNFFKPFSEQNELLMKPKLASDLQKYAEEMFKESLKTMYNSQKWNNDGRPGNIQTNSDEPIDLAKLSLELQKLRTSLTESKYKDLLEAHQSENNIRTADAPKFSGRKKKPDPLIATLEHLLKTRPGPIHIYHGEVKPGRKPKLGDSSFGASSNYDFNDDSHLEFLTPPRPDSFRSKSPFHDKPIKKRPGPRFKNGPRKLARPGSSPLRSSGLETSANNVEIFLDGTHYRKPPTDFDPVNLDYNFRHRSSHDSHPTSTPKILGKILRDVKDYDINHPRMHNLLGLLMKNKQLPNRDTQNYFHDKDRLRQVSERDRRRLQQQFYADAFKNYMDRSDVASQPVSVINRNVYSGNGTA